MEFELPSPRQLDENYQEQVELSIEARMEEKKSSVPPSLIKIVKKGENPADKSGHPYELEDMPIPKKIAPLNFLGSNFSLNFLSAKKENKTETLATNVEVRDFLRESVINFAVPSAVFKATLPVNPSVTITLEFPSVILFPSINPLNSKSPYLLISFNFE